MRGALKKPSTHINAGVQRFASSNPQREYRAKTTPKHSHVNRFGNPVSSHVNHQPTGKAIDGELVNKQYSRPARPAKHEVSATKAVAMPSMVTSASHHKLERMLDLALTSADAHKQAMKYQAARHFWQKPGLFGRRAWLKIALLAIVIFSVGVYLAWHKMPMLSTKMAATKVHVGASIPAYKPDGYTMAEPASVKSNAVVLKYKGPSDQAGFDLTQEQSHLTSTGLAQSVVPHGVTVQTSQVNGNTVYIYGPNNDAAWVNNGVLYKIKDYSRLTSDQIIKIVQGL